MGVGASLLIVGLLVLLVRRLAGNYIVDTLTTNPDAKEPVKAPRKRVAQMDDCLS